MQLRYTTVYGGVCGDKAEKEKKKDWQQLLAQVPILEKKGRLATVVSQGANL